MKKEDENGKVIYSKDTDGIEDHYEYDERGNLIHHESFFKGIKILENWYEYDEKNRIIRSSDDNRVSQYAYDDESNIIHYMDTNGVTVHYIYDEGYNLDCLKPHIKENNENTEDI